MDEEVCTLLKEWGLENYIDTFKENAITSMSLALLGSTEIRELLPVIGHRILFTRNLEDWRKAMHPNSSYVLTEETQEIPESQDKNDCLSFSLSDILPDFQGSPSTSINDDQSIHKEGIDSLDNLLENSLEGRGILSIDKNRPLDNIARLRLVRIICTHILKTSPEQNITSQVYANWTREVVRLFPSENRSVYFHNKIVDSTRGIVSRLGGKLPDHVHNLKRKYRETGIIPKRKRSFSSSPCSSRASSPAPNAIKRLATAVAFEGDDETADENLQWLRNSSHPWETTEAKWEKTTRTRLRLLKDQSISDYFSEYPALKNANGYKLLVKDFNILYSSNYEGLAENFPKLKQDLYTLAKTKPKTKDKYLSDLLSLENVSEEISNLGACLLIPSLLTTSNVRVRGANKKIWRPSKSEAREGFITHIISDADIDASIAARKEKLAGIGLTFQPFILIVEAIDVCFKIIFIVNAEYPAESKCSWMFIQKALYKISTEFDKESTAANTLLGELGVKEK